MKKEIKEMVDLMNTAIRMANKVLDETYWLSDRNSNAGEIAVK